MRVKSKPKVDVVKASVAGDDDKALPLVGCWSAWQREQRARGHSAKSGPWAGGSCKNLPNRKLPRFRSSSGLEQQQKAAECGLSDCCQKRELMIAATFCPLQRSKGGTCKKLQ